MFLKKLLQINLIKNLPNNIYTTKFRIYCLIFTEKNELAQVQFDLLKEAGFEDKLFEEQFYYLMGLNDSITKKISEDSILDFHLSRITNKENTILKNQSFSNFNLNIENNINSLINDLKLVYEDYWKSLNQINTSIKLNLSVKIKNDNKKISSFEKTLGKTNLVYNYYISKFDKEFTYYKIIFNGTPDTFLKNMNEANYNFNINNKIWTLK